MLKNQQAVMLFTTESNFTWLLDVERFSK